MAIDQEIKQLREQIEKHNKLYHEDDSPEISDAEYDALYQRLKELEALSSNSKINSPTLQVGGKPKKYLASKFYCFWGINFNFFWYF